MRNVSYKVLENNDQRDTTADISNNGERDKSAKIPNKGQENDGKKKNCHPCLAVKSIRYLTESVKSKLIIRVRIGGSLRELFFSRGLSNTPG